MTPQKTSLIRKFTLFLVAAMLSVSAMALDFNQIQRAASQGDVDAQLQLGAMYYQGDGVRQDYGKALEWFKKSANQDNAAAQAYIGIMYEFGQGVSKDKKTAKEWFGKSCDSGYQGGCDDYRKLNEQGH